MPPLTSPSQRAAQDLRRELNGLLNNELGASPDGIQTGEEDPAMALLRNQISGLSRELFTASQRGDESRLKKAVTSAQELIGTVRNTMGTEQHSGSSLNDLKDLVLPPARRA